MKKTIRIIAAFLCLLIIFSGAAVSASAYYSLDDIQPLTLVGTRKPEIAGFASLDEGVLIVWNYVENASMYRVFYKSGSAWKTLGDTSNNYFLDTDVRSGSTYTYTVRCISSDKSRYEGTYNNTGWKYTYNMDTPKITSLKNTQKGVSITWDPVPNASKYRVYVKGSNGWSRIVTTDKTEYLDTSVSLGSTYTYTVRCVDYADKKFTSSFNTTGWKITHYHLDTPNITGFDSSVEGINIKWNAVEGAEKYRVYYKGKNGWTRMATTDKTEYLDTDVSYGTTYTYTVRCVNAADKQFTSDCNSAGWKYSYMLDAPQINGFKSIGKGVQITWDKMEGAAKYRVYYKGKNGWTKMGETTGTSFIDEDVKVGSTYRYTVRCLNSSMTKFTSGYNSDGWTYTYDPKLDTPEITKVEAVANGVGIHWAPVDGADLYRVYYKGSKGWTKMADVRGTSYVDTDVSGGHTYTYTVRCLSQGAKSFASDYNHSGTKFTLLKNPEIDNISVRMDSIEVDVWAYKARVRIYRKSGSGGWTRIGEIDSQEDGSFIDYDVEPNKTYTYTARCVDLNGNFISYFNTAGWKQTYKVSECLPEPEFFFYLGIDEDGNNIALIQPKDTNLFGIKHFVLDIILDGDYMGSVALSDEPTYIRGDFFKYDQEYLMYLVGVDDNGNKITKTNEFWVETYGSPVDPAVEKTGERTYRLSWKKGEGYPAGYFVQLFSSEGEAILTSDLIKGNSWDVDLSDQTEVSGGWFAVWAMSEDEVSSSWFSRLDFSESDFQQE